MKQKFLLATLAVGVLMSLLTQKASANYIYVSEGPTREIIIDKQLKPERWSDWRDNLSSDSYVFIASDKIDFKIVVKNTGEEALSEVKITDYLPDFVNLVSGPEGHSQNGREIKWNAGHFNPGEEKEYRLQVQVFKSEDLAGRGGFCVTNWVKAQAESGEWDEDTAQFCLESRILGAVALPEAGSEVALGILTALFAAGTGWILKRK